MIKYKHKLFVPLLCAALTLQPVSIAFAEEAVTETSVETSSETADFPVESASDDMPEQEAPENSEMEETEEVTELEDAAPEEEIVEEEAPEETVDESQEEEKTAVLAEEPAGETPANTDELVQDFMDSLHVTSNFVIYGDTFNENCHIDGNIAVNNLTTDSEIETLKKGGSQGTDAGKADIDNYSIIYDGNHLKYGTVDNGAVIVSGGNLTAQNLNGGSKIVDITDALNHADTAEDQISIIADAVANAQPGISNAQKESVKNRVTQEADINGNLANIASHAAALNERLAQDHNIDGVDAVNEVINLMTNDGLNSDSIITINVTPEELNDSRGDQLTGRLNHLLQLNKNKQVGAQIILNVVNKSNASTLTITQPLNGNAAYDVYTDYVIWNFGDFGGTVTYTMTTEGIIVAPNATVNVVVMDGRVIANTINQGSGQEIHQPNNSKKEIPEDTTPENPTPDKPEPQKPEPQKPEPEEPDDSHLNDDDTITNTDYEEDNESDYEEEEDAENSDEEEQDPAVDKSGRQNQSDDGTALTTSSAKTGDDHHVFGMFSVLLLGLLTLSSQLLCTFRRKQNN